VEKIADADFRTPDRRPGPPDARPTQELARSRRPRSPRSLFGARKSSKMKNFHMEEPPRML